MNWMAIILALVGAAPTVIALVKKLWELIKQVKDEAQRKELKRRLRFLVKNHVKPGKDFAPEAFKQDLAALEQDVLRHLDTQG